MIFFSPLNTQSSFAFVFHQLPWLRPANPGVAPSMGAVSPAAPVSLSLTCLSSLLVMFPDGDSSTSSPFIASAWPRKANSSASPTKLPAQEERSSPRHKPWYPVY